MTESSRSEVLGYLKQFEYYRKLGEQSIALCTADELHWKADSESNSMASIIKHLWGNIMSRWTDVLGSDGEKEWRQRDAEFNSDGASHEQILTWWNEGWDCCMNSLRPVEDMDLVKEVLIRNQTHSLRQAIHRQLAHYPYHVGQLVYIAKHLARDRWESLSIPKSGSVAFNQKRFDAPKSDGHYTDGI